MGVAATLFGVQHLKGIEQRRSGAAQWLPGPRSIGQKDFPFRTIKLLLKKKKKIIIILFDGFIDLYFYVINVGVIVAMAGCFPAFKLKTA